MPSQLDRGSNRSGGIKPLRYFFQQVNQITPGLGVMSFKAPEVASHQASLGEIVLPPASGTEQLRTDQDRSPDVASGARKANIPIDSFAHVVHTRGTREAHQFHPQRLANFRYTVFSRIQDLL